MRRTPRCRFRRYPGDSQITSPRTVVLCQHGKRVRASPRAASVRHPHLASNPCSAARAGLPSSTTTAKRAAQRRLRWLKVRGTMNGPRSSHFSKWNADREHRAPAGTDSDRRDRRAAAPVVHIASPGPAPAAIPVRAVELHELAERYPPCGLRKCRNRYPRPRSGDWLHAACSPPERPRARCIEPRWTRNSTGRVAAAPGRCARECCSAAP